MSEVVAHVMRERAERKRVVVDGPRIPNQGLDEVPGAHVVDQIGKEAAAEGEVPEILDERPAIRVGAGTAQLTRGDARKLPPQHRRQMVLPHGVDNGFVGKDGIRRRSRWDGD
jgi:hypothetical protein